MADKLARAQFHELYYFMRLNRRVDEQLTHLYRQGKVVGGVYSSLGQEATSVGTAYALEPQDFISPVIRNVGTMLVRGFRPRDLFLQYMARQDGPTGGRDANTHFGDLSKGVVAPISMLGETVPVSAGIALASQMRKENRVAVAYVGDGACSTGPFHEGLNFAAVFKLPLVIIAENNGWAYSTPLRKQMAAKDIAARAAGYGISATIVDGNDVLKVYEATRAAAERARGGNGPVLVEAKTMRMKGHAEHDDARYVPKEEIEKWRKKDPIARFEKYLLAKKLMTAKEKTTLEERMEELIREDVEFAEASPLPPPEDAARAVWA
ncbi:MAG TPA: thiamine pyrophosphate-dependent dehydrogenase E1 component subunit alpha [Terriglobia bacterium]|nr:thiamine pyrophosphate-dependent dehydrogenase E1 component subunit alpha [Terriglobia bacterium]